MVKSQRRIYSEAQIKDILLALEVYIEGNSFPNLAGFLSAPDVRHKFKLTYQYVYDHPEIFERALSDMKARCEDYLIRQGLAGRGGSMPIFLLKQMQYGGYSDKAELDLLSNSQPIKFINSVPRPKKAIKP